MEVGVMVQLQSNTSWAASCLTLASSSSATLQTPQMLNKQSRLSRRQNYWEREKKTWQ